jgi:DnaJ-class molecular chaperone
VTVASHPYFHREGNDIRLDLPVTLGEAVLGGKVEVPTPTGRVSMSLPKGANSGTKLRLKGKGVAGKGDLYVILRIVLPEGGDRALEEFVRSWTPARSDDPRRGM